MGPYDCSVACTLFPLVRIPLPYIKSLQGVVMWMCGVAATSAYHSMELVMQLAPYARIVNTNALDM